MKIPIDFFSYPETKPKQHTPYLCYCPNWCETGYAVGLFRIGIVNKGCFEADGDNRLDEHVEGFIPLDKLTNKK